MIKKRLVFTLLWNNGNFILSRNFRRQIVGDFNWLERNYNFLNLSKYIDELIILNISDIKDNSNKKNFLLTLKLLSKKCFMPIACGGGINELSYPELLIKNGADKIVINSNLTNKKLIKKLAIKFGRQCLIGSLDFKRKKNNKYNVFVNNGRKNTNLEVIKYLNKIDLSQIGEIMINSIDNDGTGNGLDFNILKFFKKKCSIIYQGGVGNSIHFIDGLKNKKIQAVSTANLLNFVGQGLKIAREKIIKNKINIPIR